MASTSELLHTEAIAELSALGERFVCWRWETHQGRPTKPPLTTSGAYAKTTDPKTWTTLTNAEAAAQRIKADGVGFVLDATRDSIVGIDLDACRNPKTGEIADWAVKILRDINSYTEVSPSGTGVKILA